MWAGHSVMRMSGRTSQSRVTTCCTISSVRLSGRSGYGHTRTSVMPKYPAACFTSAVFFRTYSSRDASMIVPSRSPGDFCSSSRSSSLCVPPPSVRITTVAVSPSRM